jgi:hypothetical protein
MLPKTEVPLFLAANDHVGVLADWPLSGYTERTRTSEGAMSAGTGTTELHQIIHSGNLFVALCAGDEIRIFCRSSPEAARFLTERGYEFRPLPAPPYTAEEAEGCYFTGEESVRADGPARSWRAVFRREGMEPLRSVRVSSGPWLGGRRLLVNLVGRAR